MYKIMVDGVEVDDPWHYELTSHEVAFDAYLRVLDQHGALPGWLALSNAHYLFTDRDSDICLNGVELVRI